MSQTIKIAAIQMEVTPANVASRLKRADTLVKQAAEEGAHLVVLPELFNLGYTYNENNYERAEPLYGPTATWLANTAQMLEIYLVGSFLVWENNEIYNTMLLCGPNGQQWRYDKSYPWGWERAYFKGVKGITIAETPIGNIGMLICWDCAHLDLWKAYAGQLDLMVICSCPPDFGNPTYHMANGDTLTLADLGPLMVKNEGSGLRLFQDMLRQQTAWLGVPLVNTVGSGSIHTGIPNGLASLSAMIPTSPKLLKYLPYADLLEISCDMVEATQILSATGDPLAMLSQADGEALTLGNVTLAAQRPTPQGKQPPSLLHATSYWASDTLLPRLTRSSYQAGVKKRRAGR